MKVEYKITKKLTQEKINEILNIEKSKGLTAEALLESAKNKNSSLHDFFEWDDTLAGEKFRLCQARILINEVKVIIEEKEYYAFENVQVSVVKSSGKSGSSNSAELEDYDESENETLRVYKPVVEILSTEELRNQVIMASLRQLEYWNQQNSKYEEFSPIVKSFSKVKKTLDKKWQKKKK